MKDTLKKILAFLHLWLGLASGLVIMVICLTAAIWSFSPEIEGLQSFRHVTPQDKPYLPVTRLRAIANQQLPGKKVQRLTFDAKDKAAIAELYAEDYYYAVYINPYNGQVLKVRDEDHTFFRQVILGHYSLWLGDIGREIVKWATLIFLIMLISGIVLWWPKNKAARKQRFKIKLGTSPKRLNYDLHNVLGFYCAWIIVFAALTGVVWMFDWASKAEYFIASGGQQQKVYSEPVSVKRSPGIPMQRVGLDSLYNAVRTQYGNKAEMAIVEFPETDSSAIGIAMFPRSNTFYNGDYLFFDQYTMLPLTPTYWGKYEDANGGDKLSRMNYDMHIGNILGFPGRVAMFLAVLVGASLPVTGFYIWWGRKKKKKAAAKKRPRLNKDVIKTPAV